MDFTDLYDKIYSVESFRLLCLFDPKLHINKTKYTF